MTVTNAEGAHPACADRRGHAILIGICVLAAALRLYHLGYYSLWYDECASLYLTRFVDLHGSLFDFEKTTEPPMMAVLTFLWYGLVRAVTDFPVTSPANDAAIRLLPCMFGIAATPLTYAVAQVLGRNTRIGLCAAFLFAINPFQVYYAQELRIYSFVVILALVAIGCTYQALETGLWRYWFGFVFAESVMMYSHFFSVWFIFTMNLWFLTTSWHYRRYFWRWTAANAILVALIVPALIMAWRMFNMVEDLWPRFYNPPTWKTGLVTFKNLFAWYHFVPAIYWPLFALAAALFLLGVSSSTARWRAWLLVALLVVVPIGANVLMWRLRDFSFYEHRLFIVSGVVAIIGVASGVIALRRPWAIGCTLIVFTALSLLSLRETYADRLHPIEMHRIAMWNKVDIRSAARLIDEEHTPTDGVLVATHFLVYPLEHYLSRPAIRVGMSPEDATAFAKHMGNEPMLRLHGLLPQPIDEVARACDRIWFVRTFGMTFEHPPHSDAVEGWLNAHRRLTRKWEFDGVRVYLFERSPNPGTTRGESGGAVGDTAGDEAHTVDDV